MKYIIALILLLSAQQATFAQDTLAISAEQLRSLQNAPIKPRHVVLDVRSADEFAQGHIPGAINIPHDQVTQRLNELSSFKSDMIIVHCRSGRRAKIAEMVLQKQGFSKVRHLEGDYIGWHEKQLPIVNK